MSLWENSCFSPCPFLNKDLRLPRQRWLRQAQNATGAASEGHKLQRRFSSFLLHFSNCTFVRRSHQTIAPLQRNSHQERRKHCCADPPPPLQTAISQCLTFTFQSKKSKAELSCVLKAFLFWLFNVAFPHLFFSTSQPHSSCTFLRSPQLCWLLHSCSIPGKGCFSLLSQ